jgi:CheY-like chemotaxis protein
MDKRTLILVVDDNSECRRLLVSVLESDGFSTISAACGLEGVELAIRFQPRLILMDLSMPGMNGYEATRAIHAHPRGRRIPVMAVSADCPQYSRAVEAGFIACMEKPWREDALLQTVAHVLAGGVKNTCTYHPEEFTTSIR